MDYLDKAILNTLIYADIFDCSLSEHELYIKLQSSKPVPFKIFKNKLKKLKSQKKISGKSEFYCLLERDHLINLRKKRIKAYQQKLVKINKIINILKLCPWIEGIFLTGSLAVKNSSENDDIDLLLIIKNKRVWITRVWTLIISEILGKRRHPNDKDIKDKVCLNILLEKQSLKIPDKKQNLFTAHEIVQAQPVFTRESSEQLFWQANFWVTKYLPMAFKQVKKGLIINCLYQNIKDLEFNKNNQIYYPAGIIKLINDIGDKILSAINMISFYTQFYYMRSKITEEIIDLHAAFFHPEKKDIKVLKKFCARKKAFGLI